MIAGMSPSPEPTPAHVLVVDDETVLAGMVANYLQRAGFRTSVAHDGRRAVELTLAEAPDVVVLDLGLPGKDGLEVCHEIRRHSDCYIIMLTARNEEIDKLIGLSAGADDYMTKPFSPRELVVRVEAVLRRSRGGNTLGSASYDGGRLTIDRAPRHVILDGAPVALSRCEFNLLVALASRPGCVLSRQELITKVQGDGFEGCERAVDAHIKNLRRKLGDDPRHPRYVLTVWGVGYKFGGERDPS